jgi:cell division septum initiation protein DivIVA
VSDPFEGADPGEAGLVGARFHRARRAKKEPSAEPAHRDRFRVELRGYARQDVDAHLDVLQAQLDQLRADLLTAQRERDEARQYAHGLERDVADLRGRLAVREAHEPAGEVGGDMPVPDRDPVTTKVLRLAQREALLLRATARQEAVQIVEEARLRAAQERAEAERAIRERFGEPRQQSAHGRVEMRTAPPLPSRSGPPWIDDPGARHPDDA